MTLKELAAFYGAHKREIGSPQFSLLTDALLEEEIGSLNDFGPRTAEELEHFTNTALWLFLATLSALNLEALAIVFKQLVTPWVVAMHLIYLSGVEEGQRRAEDNDGR